MFENYFRPALLMLLVMTVLTGVVYPLAVTGAAAMLFSHQASGSLIENGKDKFVGSELIGQPFDAPRYFWSRPSATSPMPYNASASSGSNLGPIEPVLLTAVKDRVATLRQSDPDNQGPVPVDLVTSSGSGLDPHISPAAAEFQIARVAKARGLEETTVRDLVAQHTEQRWLGILGEPRVHVLRLNLALDTLTR